jgi:hypothetical protein
MVGVLRVLDHVGSEVLGEQGGPGFGQGGGDDLGPAVVGGGDEQLGEEALVDQAAGLRAAEAVDVAGSLRWLDYCSAWRSQS